MTWVRVRVVRERMRFDEPAGYTYEYVAGSARPLSAADAPGESAALH